MITTLSRQRPALIDLDQIRNWRKVCSSKHNDGCTGRYSGLLSSRLDTLTLVDVRTAALVTLPASTPYVALSYVWGSVAVLKAFKSNVEDLKKPGALAKDDIGIPDTIRDAMHLVKSLGEQFLWIDCWSVIQDQDKQSMDTVLSAMAYIYASAEFTIVAAHGSDANYGLRGIGGPSQQRSSTEPPFPERFAGMYPYHSIWATRGWCFQESLFSRRLLVFDKRVSWICGNNMWVENFNGSTLRGAFGGQESAAVKRQHTGIPMGLMSLIPELPDFELWKTLVRRYTRCKLTFDQDIERAFAGAAEILGPNFPGGMLHGLPIFYFDIALLHVPLGNVSRRIGQPSWSWTGWKEEHAEYEEDNLDGWETFTELQSTSPLATQGHRPGWVIPALLQSVATYQPHPLKDDFTSLVCSSPLFNWFYRYQAFRHQKNVALPKGWTRHSHPAGDHFTYSATEHDGKKYSFPLPIIRRAVQSPLHSPVLLCTAPRAVVKLNFAYRWFRVKAATLIHNGKIIGSVALQETIQNPGPAGTPCEIIALSEGRLIDDVSANNETYGVWIMDVLTICYMEQQAETVESFPDDINPTLLVKRWNRVMGPNPSDGHDTSLERKFYNVMCIGWEGDVAYRRGLGLVQKAAWDALGAKSMTFKLG
jgi:hypothetical protein